MCSVLRSLLVYTTATYGILSCSCSWVNLFTQINLMVRISLRKFPFYRELNLAYAEFVSPASIKLQYWIKTTKSILPRLRNKASLISLEVSPYTFLPPTCLSLQLSRISCCGTLTTWNQLVVSLRWLILNPCLTPKAGISASGSLTPRIRNGAARTTRRQIHTIDWCWRMMMRPIGGMERYSSFLQSSDLLCFI